MKIKTLALFSCLACAPAIQANAQNVVVPTPIAASAQTFVPALVPYSGIALTADGRPLAGDGSATFLLFKDEKGGEPLWIESQTVAIDPTGHYQVKLGATSSSGLPLDTFASGEVRWLEVQISGQPTGPRTLLTSVPYAMKAADAATLGGLPASAFVLASAIANTSAMTAAITPDASASNVTTTGGTNFYVPRFNTTTTIINSQIYDNGTSVGIGDVPNASARLDVNGAMIMRGNMTVSRTGNATASKAFPSYGFDFFSNAYDSSTKATVNPYFQLQSEPTGNDTSSPSATFNVLFSNNGSAPAETGLSINPTGTIKFASGQTFPGTGAGSITGVTAGTDLTGGGTSGAVTLNLDRTKILTGVTAGSGLTGGGTTGAVTLAVDSTTVPTLTGSPVFAGSAGDGATGNTAGTANGTAGLLGIAGSRTSFTGIAGVWGDAAAHVGVFGSSNQYPGVSGQSVSGDGVQGQSTSNSGVQGTSSSGTGVAGTSTTANGMLGYTAGGTTNTAGVTGGAGGPSVFTGSISGVWGNASAHVGVLGTSDQYQGVQGQSTFNSGVQGTSTYATGVAGTSTSADGVLGYTQGNTNGTGGVVGQAGPLSGSSGISGVWGDSSSNVGVLGTSSSQPGVQGTSNSGNGVHGVSQSTSGVFGETSSTSAADAALFGYSHSSATGVYGFSSKIGIHGVTGGASNTGAQSSTFSNGSPAIWGDGGPYAVTGTTDDGVAGQFFNSSNGQTALFALNTYNSVAAPVADFGGMSGEGCAVFGNGDLQCTGNVVGVAKASDGTRAVTTYSVQSAENWYEDAGSGKLVDGVAHVTFEATFGQTVNTEVEYHVFLTPNGDSDGLYVSNKTASGFEVHEQHGGHANIAFDYRIMAKPAGHKSERLVDVTEQMQKKVEMRQRMVRHVGDSTAVAGHIAEPKSPTAN